VDGIAAGRCNSLSYLLALRAREEAHGVGDVRGALGFTVIWAAASGRLDKGAWLLFLILFFWQFPHSMQFRGCIAKIMRAPEFRCCR
jgi:hypothetical protein